MLPVESQVTTSTSFQNFSAPKPWCDTRCFSLDGGSLLCQFRWYFGRTWSSRSNMSTIIVTPSWWKLYKVGRVSEYESDHHLIGIGFGIITYKESCEDCKPRRGGDGGAGWGGNLILHCFQKIAIYTCHKKSNLQALQRSTSIFSLQHPPFTSALAPFQVEDKSQDCQGWWRALLARHGLYGPGHVLGAPELAELIGATLRYMRDRYAPKAFLRNLRTVHCGSKRLKEQLAFAFEKMFCEGLLRYNYLWNFV